MSYNSKILLGKKIKKIRKKLRITQEKFSEIIGIETSSLSNIETGKSYPSMPTILNIISNFNIKPEELFEYDYLDNDVSLENEIMKIVKSQSYSQKQLMYRIIKQFAL